MNRVEAIQSIYENHEGALFIICNGLNSREAAYFCPRKTSFYMLHAMGESLSVGMGVASVRGDIEVVVIDGDGNALMGASSWTMNSYNNLHYYILVNSKYETTGGQELPGNTEWPSWCKKITIVGDNNKASPNPPPPEKIWIDTQVWLNGNDRSVI
jgi:thiamine pyrophosphate-dependent acetolactate synthase large subunit-like protein